MLSKEQPALATSASMREFGGKVALITGGGSGIGLGVARAFACAGAQVAIAGRTAATLMRAAAQIEEAFGTSVLATPADVGDPADCERVVAASIDRFGALDVLVNNAALFARIPLVDAEPAETRRFLRVNVEGPLNTSRAFAKWAFAHGRGGAIVNISSIAGSRPALNLGLYCASKAALETLTRVMALEWAGRGMRANAVAPGHVLTEGVIEDFRSGRLDEKAILSATPAGRVGDADDVAEAVLYLASDRARHIVGHVLTVDGGEGL